MKSLKQYYSILKKDITRNGSVARNHFLDSITGSDVQSSNLLSDPHPLAPWGDDF